MSDQLRESLVAELRGIEIYPGDVDKLTKVIFPWLCRKILKARLEEHKHWSSCRIECSRQKFLEEELEKLKP